VAELGDSRAREQGWLSLMVKPNSEEGQDRYIVPGLARGLELLKLCARSDTGVTIGDAAKALEISRSSAFRLLYTLEHTGFVLRGSDERRFLLGPEVMGLRGIFASHLDLADAARPLMEPLRDSAGLSVHLAVREEREIVYVVSLSGKKRVTTNIGVGTRLPAHATSMGRILLGALTDTEIRGLFRGVRLEAATSDTPTTVATLISLVRSDAARGHVVSLGTFDPQIWSIAAPVHDSNGRIVAALSCSCPAASATRAWFTETLRPMVCATARDVSRRIGFVPVP
jgi:DNA-binding IclR family transcriptional regulator